MRICTTAVWILGLIAAAHGAQAQSVYKIVGPDGKITFSDRAPTTAAQGKVVSTGTGSGAQIINDKLPFELRQVAAKYPVTLYTGTDCGPCGAGRALLTSRGVPFSERTVTTTEDAAALQRLTGENTLPFITIGGQRIKGYSDVEWTQYLDAAGYPKSSTLPAGFSNPAPAPLVNTQKPAPVAKQEEKPAANTPPAAASDVSNQNRLNPAGIRF